MQGCFQEAADAFAAAGAPERGVDLLADMRLFAEARAMAARLRLASAADVPGEPGAGVTGEVVGAPDTPITPADPITARLRAREGEWLEEERRDLPAAAAAFAEVGSRQKDSGMLHTV